MFCSLSQEEFSMTAVTEGEVECIVSLSSSVLSMIGSFIIFVLELHNMWTERVPQKEGSKLRRTCASFVLNLALANFICGFMHWVHFGQMLSWPASTHVWDEHFVQMVELGSVFWTFGTICFLFVVRVWRNKCLVIDGESSPLLSSVRRADTILYVSALLAFGVPIALAVAFKIFERWTEKSLGTIWDISLYSLATAALGGTLFLFASHASTSASLRTSTIESLPIVQSWKIAITDHDSVAENKMFNGYVLVFALVWVGVLIEALTNQVSTNPFVLLEVARAALEPLQGFLNCCVYVHVFLYRIHAPHKYRGDHQQNESDGLA